MNPLIFIPLLLTIFIEFIIYSVAIRKKYGGLILYSILINAFTNPLANFVLSQIKLPLFTSPFFIIIEFLVFIVEIFLIKYLLEVSYKKAIIISLIANVITAFISLFFL